MGKAEGGLIGRVRNWLPLAIVVVSVLAAVMGWRASVADEKSAHIREIGRQDLLQQQQTELQIVQAADSDIGLFGKFEQYSLLAHELMKNARSVGGAERQKLVTEAHSNIEVAREVGSQLPGYSPSDPSNYYSVINKAGVLQANGTYRPGSAGAGVVAIGAVENSDAALTSLEPDRLLSEATIERGKGVHLVGVAALFIAGLVFFTLAAVSRGPRLMGFAASGVGMAMLAFILFSIVELS